MRQSFVNTLLATIFALLLPACSADKEHDYSSEIRPAMEVTLEGVGGTTATFSVKSINATAHAVLCLTSSDAAPSAEDILSQGQAFQPGTLTIACANEGTVYVAYFAARDNNGKYSDVVAISFETPDSLYPWERARLQGGFKTGPGKSGRFEPYDNLLLIYGGNIWRTPVKWDKTRMQSQITYTDKSGVEHWLFDAFLALEIWDRLTDGSHSASLGTGYGGDSADKAHWTHFIDYWFEDGYGFDALDNAVGSAIKRIGAPSTTRKVIVSIPDPIMFKNWKDSESGSEYWGELDGRALDFRKADDRIAACKWFIDEVRARWAEKDYANIELYGFYCFSEEIATPTQGYDYKYKKLDQVYPEVSDYLHSINEPISWIPYNWAAGFDRWTNFGFDFVMMQPNYEWHAEYSMTDWMARARSANTSMEFEFDERALEGGDDWQGYRSRFLYYIDMCKSLDFYGKTVLSYYMDGNGLYRLAHSTSTTDRELYDTLCNFVIGNIQH